MSHVLLERMMVDTSTGLIWGVARDQVSKSCRTIQSEAAEVHPEIVSSGYDREEFYNGFDILASLVKEQVKINE